MQGSSLMQEEDVEHAERGVAVSNLTEWASQWKEERMSRLQPWSSFFDRTKVSLPQPAQIPARLSLNIVRFQTNYIIVTLILSLWCIITNPLFLVGLLAAAGMWFYAFWWQPHPAKLFNALEMNDKTRTLVLLPVTLLIFYLTSVGLTIFWLFGATIALVLGHALLIDADQGEGSLQSKFQQMMSF